MVVMKTSTAPRSDRSPLRVLLAEDDDAMRPFLAEMLRGDGYDVTEVSNGRDLFWLVEMAPRERPFDLILTDMRMPGYDGLDVVEAWAEGGPGPRVILMSAFPDEETRRRAEQLGVLLIDKPFDLERLLKLVSLASARPASFL